MNILSKKAVLELLADGQVERKGSTVVVDLGALGAQQFQVTQAEIDAYYEDLEAEVTEVQREIDETLPARKQLLKEELSAVESREAQCNAHLEKCASRISKRKNKGGRRRKPEIAA